MQAERSDPRLVSLSTRLYRVLLAAYPARFRHEYGPLMVQVFHDSCLSAARQGQPAALAVLWVRTLADYFLSIVEQYAQGGSGMTKAKWIKLSGWLLTASSLLFLLAFFAGSRPIYNQYNAASWPVDRYLNQAVLPAEIMAILFTMMGLLGLQARYAKQASSLGRLGLGISLAGGVVALAGVVGQSIVDSSPWWEAIMLGTTALFTGLILFGINCQRLKLLPRWNSLPLLTGIPWLLAILFNLGFSALNGSSFDMPAAATVTMLLLSFGGLALIGYRLQADTSAPSQPLTI